MKIDTELSLPVEEAATLYNAVGWTRYTKDLAKLRRAFDGSTLILAAREDDGTLIGLARVISDGETVCYVQDFLVLPECHRRGVGRALMAELRRRFDQCPFFLLSTDPPGSEEAVKSHPFYRSVGMIAHEEQKLMAFGLPVDR
ncbi:GNAT family N-acetyltransferase [Actinokineospora sp. HUAS TT18]|uniref:GNAT family N-acetyltransferase n=1 Tax=Actinokineospora sp. HUAS TT18 TaxID=3447451 RepID=UPI003F5263F7